MSATNVLTQKYDIEPLADSVVRLSQLVMKRDADIPEIIKVISSDIALKARLLRAASPSDGNVKVLSVEEAVLRTGVGCLLVLAMSDPLRRALIKTFSTMADLRLETADAARIGPLPGAYYMGSATFTGRASGAVYMRLQESFARHLTAQIIGTSSADEISDSVRDVLSELVNMVVGNFKSNLCDAGLTCKLSLPNVVRTAEHAFPNVPVGRHQVFAFRHQQEPVLLDILVNSTE